MAKIQLGEFGYTTPQPVPGPRAQPGQTLDLRGVERLGNALTDSAFVMDWRRQADERQMDAERKQSEDRDARIYTASAEARFALEEEQDLALAKTQARDDGKGFFDQFSERQRKRFEKLQDEAPSPLAIQYLNERREALTARGKAQAFDFERSTHAAYQGDLLETSIESRERLLTAYPDRYAETMTAAMETLPDMEPAARQKVVKEIHTRLSNATMIGRIKRDPEGEYRKLYAATLPDPIATLPDGTEVKAPDVPAWQSKARGIRNNNPGNLVKTAGNDWQGKIPGTDPKFETFDTPEAGIRAIAVTLSNYGSRYDINSIDEIAARYAPASENDTKAYAAAIAKKTGFPADMNLDMRDEGNLFALSKAIIEHENGENPYSDKLIRESVQRALGFEVPEVKLLGDAPAQPTKAPLPPTAQAVNSTAQLDLGPGMEQTATTIGPDGVVRVGAALTLVQPKKTGDFALDSLTIEQRLRLLDEAKRESAGRMNEYQHALQVRVRDDTSAAFDGKPTQKPVSVGEFVRAYGQDEGSRLHSEYVKTQQYARDLQTVSGTAPQADEQMLAAMNPKPGPGYEAAAKRYEGLVRAVQGKRKLLEDDPAAYVGGLPGPVADKFRAVTTSTPETAPQAAQAYAAATLAEQMRLGAPEPKVLPKIAAENLVRTFEASMAGGQLGAAFIREQARMWGDYWPQVYGQVAKSLTPAVRVLANMGDTPAAGVLAQAAKTKTAELRDVIDKADAKTIDDEVQGSLESFRLTMVSPGGMQAHNEFREQAQRLAYIYAGRGESAKDAARRAANEVVNDYYTFAETYRIPKSAGGDPGSMQVGAEQALADIGKLPLALPAEAKAAGAKWTQEQIASSLRDRARWYTLPDETGVVLLMRGADGGLWSVERDDGRSIVYKWADLEGIGKDIAETPRGFALPDAPVAP